MKTIVAAAVMMLGVAAFAPVDAMACASCGKGGASGAKVCGDKARTDAKVVSWNCPCEGTFESARSNNRAIILYFEDTTKDAKWLEDVDLVDLQNKGLVACVKVSKDETRKNDAASSAIATKKVAANDLWEAYRNPAAGTFVICDEHGNEFARSTEKKLAKTVTTLKKQVKERRAAAETLVANAEKLVGEKNDAGAVKDLLAALKMELVGWAEYTRAAELYNGVMARARESLTAARQDSAKLRALSDAFKGSDVEAEINAAIKAAAATN